ANPLHRGQEVVEREGRVEDLAGLLLGLLLGNGGLDLLDQGEDVAHPEDAGSDAVGMERLEVGQLLPHAGELDRLAGDGGGGERRAAPGVAAVPRADDAAERNGTREVS